MKRITCKTFIRKTIEILASESCLEFSHPQPRSSILFFFFFALTYPAHTHRKPQTNSKPTLSILPKDQRKLIVVICSQWDSKGVRRSCWSVLKRTEGSYFISKDNLFFSVCHMVLQLQRSNRFVDVNFSSLLKNLSCMEIFIKYLDHCCQPGLLESRIACWFCKQLWMVVFICLGL